MATNWVMEEEGPWPATSPATDGGESPSDNIIARNQNGGPNLGWDNLKHKYRYRHKTYVPRLKYFNF